MNLKLIAAVHVVFMLSACSAQSDTVPHNVSEGKIVHHKVAPPDNVVKVSDEDLECLAHNIYYEARGEPEYGKYAVAMVTLNRATSKEFPNNICKVVYQKNQKKKRVICQFSWVCSKRPPLEKSSGTYEVCLRIARDSIINYEHYSGRVVGGAMFYHADYIDPKWSKRKGPKWAKNMKSTKKIGKHIFYTHDGHKT